MGSLLAYDGSGNVTHTLDYRVLYDENDNPLGLVDFASHEEAGGEHTDVWVAHGAAGSKTWPEHLGAAAHGFRVELDGPPGQKRITALVHKESGHRRERGDIETAIRAVPFDGNNHRDLRAIVGGPGRPLQLDGEGRTRPPEPPRRPVELPLVGRPG